MTRIICVLTLDNSGIMIVFKIEKNGKPKPRISKKQFISQYACSQHAHVISPSNQNNSEYKLIVHTISTFLFYQIRTMLKLGDDMHRTALLRINIFFKSIDYGGAGTQTTVTYQRKQRETI